MNSKGMRVQLVQQLRVSDWPVGPLFTSGTVSERSAFCVPSRRRELRIRSEARGLLQCVGHLGTGTETTVLES